MEKKVGLLPFSFGCVSQTSVALGEVQSKKVKQESKYKSSISLVMAIADDANIAPHVIKFLIQMRRIK